MKKMRKTISMIICVVLLITSSTSMATASTIDMTEKSGDLEKKVSELLIDETQEKIFDEKQSKKMSELKETAISELEILEKYSFSIEMLKGIDVLEDSQLTYRFQLKDVQEESCISIKQNKGENLILKFKEGDLCNVLEISVDGTMWLDGFKLNITKVNPQTPGIIPHGTIKNIYSETPFFSTSADDYDIFLGNEINENVALGQEWKNLTISVLVGIMTFAITQVVVSGIVSAALTEIITELSTRMRSAGQTYAPDEAFFSYAIGKYQHPKSTATCAFYKYRGVYYTKKNRTGHSIGHVFYQNYLIA